MRSRAYRVVAIAVHAAVAFVCVTAWRASPPGFVGWEAFWMACVWWNVFAVGRQAFLLGREEQVRLSARVLRASDQPSLRALGESLDP